MMAMPTPGGGGLGPATYSFQSSQPNYEAAVHKIQYLSKDELQDLLNNDSAFERFIQGLEQIQSLQGEKEMLMASNKSLAEYNLSQEPVLRRIRLELEARKNEAATLIQEVRSLLQSTDQRRGQTDPETLLALLRASAANVDEESDQIATDFLDDKFESVDRFLEAFIEKRKVSHLRKVKGDKLEEMIEERRRKRPTGVAGLTPARNAPPPPPAIYRAPNGPPTALVGNLPYPVNPVGMPSPY
ncbi:hypothetical protein TCAL_04834 [Tigriopus californicus]|uniref:VPS37 C-terminal domain-containing protein n=1 Tax=Tigriopus californicus TaxID=6832 RepID=A0A553NY92_TIGCA|nr:vacuolar protein sorting-associated protein 37B-like [Tigriopus californicus]XP_059090965.1 vacuolar protein sorting-associated protein 37B-like [Tigriopus californicus]XP_059090966.1 vacuolar protein sorting-associated protein 37B-like [Tigriopus californicus]TRY70390.1 hypothetical protein TCAL_04834 [Tigriopus californicus]|eukprot:TCALIF_04834-PA protein Name:"Similar to VPS37B Vacuolar protein sorting-associated protein 37B (Homo sapiens)" AED:0.03 eAED:0.03 QI:27/1/1/1/0.75/0.6/5/505/242